MCANKQNEEKLLKYIRQKKISDLTYKSLCDYLKRHHLNKIECLSICIDNLLTEYTKNKMSGSYSYKLFIFTFYLLEDVTILQTSFDKQLITKLKNIPIYYQNSFLRDSKYGNLEEILKRMQKIVNNLENNESEVLLEYLKKIEELTFENNQLINTIANQKEQIKDLEEKIASLNENELNWYKIQKQGNSSIEKIEKYKQQMKELTQRNEILRKKLEKGQKEKRRIQEEYNELEKKCNIIKKEIEKLNSLVAINEEQPESRKKIDESSCIKSSVNKDFVENKLIELIYNKTMSLNQIQEQLAEDKIKLSIADILEKLESLQSKIDLEKREKNGTLYFKFPIPKAKTNTIYNITIKDNCYCYDMLAVADFHIRDFDDKMHYNMDLMYEYCIKNNIHFIINAGDFFSLKDRVFNSKCKYSSLKEAQVLVEKVITCFPYHQGIYQGIMGGNHDKKGLKYGFDAIENLTQNRDDFIDFGYDNCLLTFEGYNSIICKKCNSIAFHHPHRRYKEEITPSGYNIQQLLDYVRPIDTVLKKNSEIYLDIFGHFHKSGFDPESGICLVPSYNNDRFMNGAWHLKIYFDKDKNIKNIVLIPLIKTNELTKTSEINYVKKLTK